MKKRCSNLVLFAAIGLLSGCAAPPEPPPAEVPLTRLETLRMQAADLRKAGVPAVVGIGESRHLELAVRRARAEGRRKLSRLLIARARTLEKALLARPDLAEAGAVRGAFDLAAAELTGPGITALAEQRIEHESGDVQFSVYALTVLDPALFSGRLRAVPELAEPLRSAELLTDPPRGEEAFAVFKTSLTEEPGAVKKENKTAAGQPAG